MNIEDILMIFITEVKTKKVLRINIVAPKNSWKTLEKKSIKRTLFVECSLFREEAPKNQSIGCSYFVIIRSQKMNVLCLNPCKRSKVIWRTNFKNISPTIFNFRWVSRETQQKHWYEFSFSKMNLNSYLFC